MIIFPAVVSVPRASLVMLVRNYVPMESMEMDVKAIASAVPIATVIQFLENVSASQDTVETTAKLVLTFLKLYTFIYRMC